MTRVHSIHAGEVYLRKHSHSHPLGQGDRWKGAEALHYVDCPTGTTCVQQGGIFPVRRLLSRCDWYVKDITQELSPWIVGHVVINLSLSGRLKATLRQQSLVSSEDEPDYR
jgi:hypothetical protein